MPLVIVTGSTGLLGSQAARTFSEKGYDVVGIDNGMRGYFFGSDGDNSWASNRNNNQLKNFRHEAVDIREQNARFQTAFHWAFVRDLNRKVFHQIIDRETYRRASHF